MAVCKCGAYLVPESTSCNVCGRSVAIQLGANINRLEKKRRRKRFRLKNNSLNSAKMCAIITGILFITSGLQPWFSFHAKGMNFEANPTLVSSEFGAFCIFGGAGLIVLALFYPRYARGLLVIMLFIAIGGSLYELYSIYDAYNQLSTLGSLFGYESSAGDIFEFVSKYISLKIGAVSWLLAIVTGLYSNKLLDERYV